MTFFPVASTTVSATTSASSGVALPGTVVNGTQLRITRQSSTDRAYIKFGSSASVAATTSSIEIVSGIVEIWEMVDASSYAYYSVITNNGTVAVNISVGPKFSTN